MLFLHYLFLFCVFPSARWSATIHLLQHLGVFDVAFCPRLPVCGCWRKTDLAHVSAVFLLRQASSDLRQVHPSGKDILQTFMLFVLVHVLVKSNLFCFIINLLVASFLCNIHASVVSLVQKAVEKQTQSGPFINTTVFLNQ